MQETASLVTEWLGRAGRNMPWRNTRDPYQIWLAEVILQQTRIETGVAYLERFLQRFPSLEALAAAPQDEVLKAWEGLGYYSRARNLHAAAAQLLSEFGGKFPSSVPDLLRLKGVGPYTARAIASFAFDAEVAVLDGNVMRVVSRLLGSASPIDLPATRQEFQLRLDAWVKGHNSRAFNHGMMDIGSTICTPTMPGCMVCPLESRCVARAEGITHLLPVKGKKLIRKLRFFDFYLLHGPEGLLIRQRPAQGLWGGLWEVPNEEREAEQDGQLRQPEARLLGTGKHVFTHFDMAYRVWEAPVRKIPEWTGAEFQSWEKIPTFAFPRAVLNMFDLYLPPLATASAQETS